MTLAIDKPTFAPRPKRWTKREYNTLVDRGMFNGHRLYLHRGELIEVAPMGMPHARGVVKINTWLVTTFHLRYVIRCQSPFETPGESIPEPDGGLFAQQQALRDPHPNAALLLIEVSDSSLDIDREKAFDYAAANVPEYWIVDVVSRSLEVYRQPVADQSAFLGFRYASRQLFAQSATLAPLVDPAITVAVSDLLP